MLDISIVTYNSKKWVAPFFRSIQKQLYPLDSINFYITDNGSTDGTIKTIENIVKKQKIPSVNIFNSENKGFGSGHNNNFKHCQSKYVLVTNIDLEFEADALIKLFDFAQQDEEAAACWEVRQKPYEHPKVYNPVTLETPWCSSACVLFRKEALDKIQGYEEKIFMYGEDVDISWRLRAHGYKLKYFPSATCWHYTYEEQTFKKIQYLESIYANLCLRARFGNNKVIEEGESLIKELLAKEEEKYDGEKKDLQNIFYRYRNDKSFFHSSGYSNKEYIFRDNWDYAIHRGGAFFRLTNSSNDNNPKVSIIVRTYRGREEYLQQSLQSILNQTYQNFEIVVVEDGPETLKSIIDQFEDERIRYYCTQTKDGRCVSGNLGLKKASGEYFNFLDDDDLFFADHLEVLIQELKENTEVDAVYANAFEMPSNGPRSLANDLNNLEIRGNKDFNHLVLWSGNYIPIQAVLFSRRLYDQLGGFDEYPEYLEDWNLWTRYTKISSFKYINKTTSLYRIPGTRKKIIKRLEVIEGYFDETLKKQKDMQINLPMLSLKTSIDSFINIIVSERRRTLEARRELLEARRELEKQRDALEKELFRSHQENAATKKKLESILKSRSWKLTHPIRKILDLIRFR